MAKTGVARLRAFRERLLDGLSGDTIEAGVPDGIEGGTVEVAAHHQPVSPSPKPERTALPRAPKFVGPAILGSATTPALMPAEPAEP